MWEREKRRTNVGWQDDIKGMGFADVDWNQLNQNRVTGGSCEHVKQNSTGAVSFPHTLLIKRVIVSTLITVRGMEPCLWGFTLCSDVQQSVK